jgi:hypothetical protein
VKIEGFFSSDEVAAAQKHGAAVAPLAFNRLCLQFPTPLDYDQWMQEQMQLHPTRWSSSFSLRKSEA